MVPLVLLEWETRNSYWVPTTCQSLWWNLQGPKAHEVWFLSIAAYVERSLYLTRISQFLYCKSDVHIWDYTQQNKKNLWITFSVRCWFIRQIFICFIALYAGYYARYSHSLSLRNSKLLSFQGSTSYSIYAAFALVNVPTRRRSWETLMSGGPDLYPKRT